MTLTQLIINALKEDKLDEMETIKMLSSEIENQTEVRLILEKIYKKAYGDTISKELADEVVKGFAVTDGSIRENGQKWSMEQTTAVGSEIGIDWGKWNKIEFYIVMNMAYSDYRKTAEKVEYEDDPKFYAYLAKDWLCDEDAPKDKLYRYIFRVLM